MSQPLPLTRSASRLCDLLVPFRVAALPDVVLEVVSEASSTHAHTQPSRSTSQRTRPDLDDLPPAYSDEISESATTVGTGDVTTIISLETSCEDAVEVGLPGYYPTGIERYLAMANDGNADAMFIIGNMYHEAKGVSQDYKTAMELYLKAVAATNHTSALNNIAMLYQFGQGVTQDFNKTVEYYLKAVEQGYGVAQYNLGRIYISGEGGVEVDYPRVMELFRASAAQGEMYAQHNIGYMYKHGRGVDRKDYLAALFWFRKAALQGHAASLSGVLRDYNKAMEWFLKAAEQGYDKAQYSIGELYDYGEGVEKDHDKALEWYLKAAEKGHADAQCNAGNIYQHGLGVERDCVEASKWFKKSAEGGLDTLRTAAVSGTTLDVVIEDLLAGVEKTEVAQEKQGTLAGESTLTNDQALPGNITATTSSNTVYQENGSSNTSILPSGNNSKPSAYQDRTTYSLVAMTNQGDARVPISLGDMYKNGDGVEQDYQAAVEWYLKAAQQGHASRQM
ncbi:hypothetical protein BGX23_012518 [Mortierella sp. AD031]|nr:hypothetical protein BGX23_012518 [Mortierella sp. AD031]